MADETKRGHTPGPWVVWRGGLVRAPIQGRENCSQVVARTDSPYLQQQEGESDADLYLRSQREQDANAALIAAAPDFYAAAKRLVAQSDHMAAHWDSGDWRAILSITREMVEQFRAAVTTAEVAR